ncbi:MAG: hypothetical protein AAGA58_01110 [Verrucomicrobiota bacterium]
MKTHEWRETTPEGETRYYQALHHGGGWQVRSRLKNEEEWQNHEPPTPGDLHVLRDLLWRKYQRRRCPWEDVDQIDKMIEALNKDD